MTKYRLDQIGKVIGGGTPSTRKKQYYANKGIAWITPKDLSGYSKMYISHGARDISQEGLDNSSAKLLPKDTVLVSSRAPIGYVALAANKITTNQGFKSIVPNTDIVLPKYLYYLMLTKKDELENVSSGSTFKEVSGRVMKGFEVDIPSLDKQANIIQKIEPITRKIELNYQINANLAEINKTVFSNFFANQNSITKASDIADIRIGKTPPRKQKKWFSLNGGYKWLSIKDMKRDGIFALHTEEFLTKEAIEKYNIQVVPKHTVMLSFKLTIGRVKISEENMVTNEAIAQFRNSKLPYEYLYTYLDNFSFETLGSTSSIAQAINSRIIKSMPILIPERDLLNKYLNFARPIFSKMLILQKENIKLNRLKQVLLDKYF